MGQYLVVYDKTNGDVKTLVHYPEERQQDFVQDFGNMINTFRGSPNWVVTCFAGATFEELSAKKAKVHISDILTKLARSIKNQDKEYERIKWKNNERASGVHVGGPLANVARRIGIDIP